MNQLQERRRSMYYVVQDYLTTVPAATIATMPEFDTKLITFTATVALITAQSESQSTNRLGYRMVKDDLKLVMTVGAIDAASRIKAYATNTNDTVLRQEVSQRISLLMRKPDTICGDICRYIHNKGTELLTDLATYGVTATLLTHLSDSIDNYIAYIPRPRAGIVAKKQATTQMRFLFKDSDTVLKEMDTLVTMLQFTAPEVYAAYFSSRRLIKPGFLTLSLRGIITNTEGMPIQKATITIDSIGITRKTTDKGNFEIKDMKSGMYTLVISKPGYLKTKSVVAVTATERTQFSAVLEPDRNSEKVA